MSEWISVKDRLPKQRYRFAQYIVAVNWGDGWAYCVDLGTFDNVQLTWKISNAAINALLLDGADRDPDCGRVTHWMPMPELPEQEEENDK